MARHLTRLVGTVKLAELLAGLTVKLAELLAGLKVRDVDFARSKLAKRLSTRSVRLARMILVQAIRNAMVDDLVVRNAADLAAIARRHRHGGRQAS